VQQNCHKVLSHWYIQLVVTFWHFTCKLSINVNVNKWQFQIIILVKNMAPSVFDKYIIESSYLLLKGCLWGKLMLIFCFWAVPPQLGFTPPVWHWQIKMILTTVKNKVNHPKACFTIGALAAIVRKVDSSCKKPIRICNSNFMALVVWNYFKTVLIWEIFNPNYDFQVSLCLCLVKKYWKSAVANEKCFFASLVDYKHLNSVQVANDKCVFATCTEFSILQTLHINLDIFPWRFVSAK
jgi:hypothetical protein